MSKISELGPIKGANTRSEDLFVIVNLIQGDDGTKNITRKELVQALQYEIFDRITITGGSISGVRIFNSTIEDNQMNRNDFDDGTVNDSVLNDNEILDGTMARTEVSNVTIVDSDFSDGTGNNNVFTFTIIDFGQFNNGTGNNNLFTNSTIDDSLFNNGTYEAGTANNLFIDNSGLARAVIDESRISNSTIEDSSIQGGTQFDTQAFGLIVANSSFTNSVTNGFELNSGTILGAAISTSTFANGVITDTDISDSDLDNVLITNSVFANGEIRDTTANNIQITDSDFSNGTGNNNTFTNPTLENATLTGAMNDVVAENISIGSSTSEDLVQQRSTIQNSDISDSTISNTTIEETELVDFDMNLTKQFEPLLDEDSYFALKNVQTGDTERMTYRQLYDEFSKKTEKSLKVHVSTDGDDKNPGTILQPIRTLKRAEELALQKAGGSFDRNDINNAVHISCGPGTYYVDEPISLPDDCSLTSTAGQYATVIQKKKGYEKTNGILVGSGCYVQGFSYMNFEVDNFDQPEGGFAIAYRPGALLRRSPYLRDSSQLSNFNRLDVEPPLNPFNSKGNILDLGQEFYLEAGHSPQAQFQIDDEVTFSSGASGYISYIADIDSASQIYVRNLKGNVDVGDMLYAQRGGTGTVESIGIDDFPNRLVGRGGGCLLADRAVLDTDSLYTYVLCFGFTPRTQNGTGYVAKNGAGVNGIGSLSIFTRQAFFALDGGQMTLNNSGSQFGDISMRARGSTVIIKPAQANDLNLISNTDFADTIDENQAEIIDNMIDYLTANTTTGFEGGPGLGYQGYNADKCFRDTGLIVDSASYDVATNSNYWGRLNGITYRSPISYVVISDQMTETVGSIEHIKADINHIFTNEQSGEVQTRLDRSLDETLNILQNGEEAAEDIIFANTGDTDAVAARELVQDNRNLIIDEFVDWIDNNDEFYAYDGDKCERDVKEYILPATKFDMLLDTNYNAVTTGLAYYVNTARTSLENQRNETVAAFERLRKTTDEIIQDDSPAGAVDAYASFNTIINALANSGKKYTPTKVTYDPETGRMVITIGTHDLTVGRYVNIAEGGVTFTCASDNFKTQISHPRKVDKAYLAALPIVAVSAKTITVNPGLGKANFEHRFVEAKDHAVSVIGDAITFSDNSSIDVNKRNARAGLQLNREFVQDYMMDWVDNEFYFYDSKKCHRDTEEYILPAVQRDVMLGTNYNSIQTGAAYRTKSGEVSVTDQLVETVGSINYLKAETADLVTNSIAEDRANKAFDEMTRLLNNNGKKYTPTNAVYTPTSGTTVLTIGSHDFQIGDSIFIEPNSLTFTCALDGNVTEHSYPTTEFINYTPTTASYDPATGEFSANIGTNALKAGDLVEFKPNSIVFTCALDGDITNHPAPESHHPFYKKQIVIDRVDGNTIHMNVGGVANGGGLHTFVSAETNAIQAEKRHPAYKKSIKISDRDATTITVNVGESSDTSVHTFVSATTNAIREGDMWTGTFTPETATYDPVSGDMELTIGNHDLPVGKWIEIAPESIVFSCDVGGVTGTDAAPLYDHPAYKEPVRVKAVTGNTITVNVGNANGHANNHTFVSATSDCIDANALFFSDPAKVLKAYTPTTADYDPVTGILDITIPGHDLTTDDHIELQPQSFAFSCAHNGGGTDFSPRIGDWSYKLPLAITNVAGDVVTVYCGTAGTNTDTHTFVSADEGAVIKVAGSQQGVYASRILQKNKAYLQAEVDAYMNDNYFIYDKDKCMRDTGFILNAVARDIATDSNVNSIYVGKGYRIGTVGANNVVNNQLTETVGAITWLKDKIATEVLTDATAIARSNASFDEIIDIMSNGNAAADALVFGGQSVSIDAYAAKTALQNNKAFIQKEVIAWIAANHPGFTYDQAACERDLGIFVDTASWDLQHGGNAATVNNSRLYFENALPVLSDEEIVPTSGAYEFVSYLVGQIVRGETVTPLQGTETQVLTDEESFSPSNATYDPVTGVMVLTIGVHTFAIGDRISIDPNAITFQCAFNGGGTDSHPNANDPNLGKPYVITDIAAQTITVNAGSAGSNTDVHSFISATANSVRRATMADAYTATDIAYNHLTGVMTMTLGDRHRFVKGDHVIFDENAITFSCPTSDSDPTPINISHPRPTDPIFNKPVRIDSVTSTTITMQVGKAGVDKVHTFVSATTNGLRRSLGVSIASRAVNLFAQIGETLEQNDGTVPTVVEPVYKLTSNYPLKSESEAILGQKPKYQTEIIDHIYETFDGHGYEVTKCSRDVGYIVDAISEDLEYGGDTATVYNARYYFEGAVNTLPYYQREPSRLAFTHIADVMEKVVKNEINEPVFGSRFTPTNATYDPVTGIMVATIGTHTLTTDDYIWFTEGAITFSCDTGSGAQDHASPEAHHRFHHKPCPIIGVSGTTITMWVSAAGAYTGAHTFVSALTDGLSQVTGNLEMQNVTLDAADAATGLAAKNLAMIIANVVDDRLVVPDYTGSLDISVGQQTPRPLPVATGGPLMDPARTFARKTLQWNREFIQEEVVRFVRDNNYTYDEAKCARDVGFIIDAVARDVQTGSDYPSQYYGKAYRVGTALAQNVINEQLSETVEAIEYVQDDILPRLSGAALTRATNAFNNVINIMKNGTAGVTYDYGIANVGNSDAAATQGLTLNIPFLQEEAIAWIAQNHGSLVYDETKCRRDVGFLVEATAYDIRHGSNVAMRDFAKLYFENGINVGLPEAQRAPTAALYNHLAAVAEQVVLKQTVTPTTGNGVSQVTSGFGNVVGASGIEVELLIKIVADIITDDSLINLPQAREATITDAAATGYNFETEKDLILGRKEALGSSVVQYLNDKFAFLQYEEARCRRDTGYIVDAISHDIQYGGNAAMHGTAELYFKNAVNILPIDQRQATREAFEYMAKVVQHVVRNEPVEREIGNQFTPTSASYDPDSGIFTATLGTGHGLTAGDHVMIAPESIVFTCSLDGDIAEHPSPQLGDPYYGNPYYITSADATTITMQVGKVAYGKGGGAHTFVRASLNAISHVTGNHVKQEMPTIATRRPIATEAMNLALMLSKVSDDNSPSAIPARVEPFTNWIDADILAAKNVIDNNTVQMATDLQTYIYDTYNGISYSKEKCRRDVGTMIDALSHDVNYSTNYATVQTAGLYFVNAVSVLPADQRQQTARFFTELADTVEKIVVGGTVDTSISKHSSSTQVAVTAATAVEAEEVADLVRIVEDTIRRDSIDAIPAITEPDLSWVDADRIAAANSIDENLDELADDVTEFLKDTFTIVDYSKAKCRRDAGYILDAMSWDLNYGGNLATRWNANFYFWNNELRVPEDTREATAQAYRQLGYIVAQIVRGTYPGQVIRSELGTEVQSKQATDLGLIFYNALFYNDVNKLGPSIDPDFGWETDKTFKFAKDILGDNRTRIQREVQRFITSEYKFIDLPKTYRDAGNFLKVIQNDFRYTDPSLNPNNLYNVSGAGADQASRSFVGALFNIDAQHVFPVFNPPASFANWRNLRFKGTVVDAAARDALTDMKRWDAYIIPTNNNDNRYVGEIFHWTGVAWASVGQNNTDLLDAFTGAWTQMKTYINNNIAPDLTHRNMVTELIDNVIIDSVIRPNFLVFGSLVESIAHQFNGASAGVNRNALPLNFRNVGAAIGANASVLSENGGRIRWSGSDELNNQYFARGLKINGRTGRIEGRPFTSSVRKLARRASNSRASL
jgi:hypothetical protein